MQWVSFSRPEFFNPLPGRLRYSVWLLTFRVQGRTEFRDVSIQIANIHIIPSFFSVFQAIYVVLKYFSCLINVFWGKPSDLTEVQSIGCEWDSTFGDSTVMSTNFKKPSFILFTSPLPSVATGPPVLNL